MRLELTEKVVIEVPPGTEQAIAEVANRREVTPDDYLRSLVLTGLQRHTGFSAKARARELDQQHTGGPVRQIAA